MRGRCAARIGQEFSGESVFRIEAESRPSVILRFGLIAVSQIVFCQIKVKGRGGW